MTTKHKIKLCCQMFFADGRLAIRDEIPEYQSTMHILTNNDGVILCPNCVRNTLHSKCIGDES